MERETAVKDGPLGRNGLIARKRPTLTWKDAGGAHSLVVETLARIGSAGACVIHVDDPTASRLHAEVELLDDGLWIRDLGSKNGTFVQDVLIDRARIPDGAAVRVGSTTLTVAYEKVPMPVDLWPEDHFHELIGGSPAMRELYMLVSKFAPLPDTVLIQGETGTGKELVANAIHQASPRAAGPMIVVDCGSATDELLESELFGHVRGAFTGADRPRAGSVEAAAGGTLFLDEIGELPLSMQPKLLRLLDTNTFRPIGDDTYRTANVRFVAATHRDLGSLVNQGAFREDLYFRIAALVVPVPPLRLRAEDIPALVTSFLPEKDHGALFAELVAEAMGRAWPGNVRELRNFVSRALVLRHLEQSHSGETPATSAGPARSVGVDTSLPLSESRERVIASFEKAYVSHLLQKHERSIVKTAEEAGVSRSYIHRLILKYGI